jgi:GNAT superfamily N-acetyltransferase
VKSENWERVDLWVADLFGLPASMLWQPGVTVGMHAGLGDFPGIVVMGREGAAHVSLPDWAGRDLVDDLAEQLPVDLLNPKLWKGYEPTTAHRVVGPVIHSFTDKQLEAPNKVERIDVSDVAGWQDLISRRKWEASGFAAEVPVAFGIRHHDELAAASNLTAFRGVPSDVGVLTHPKFRGKGFASRVARAATAYAVRSHDIARYRAVADNERSRAIAATLGFKGYFEELIIMPR